MSFWLGTTENDNPYCIQTSQFMHQKLAEMLQGYLEKQFSNKRFELIWYSINIKITNYNDQDLENINLFLFFFYDLRFLEYDVLKFIQTYIVKSNI